MCTLVWVNAEGGEKEGNRSHTVSWPFSMTFADCWDQESHERPTFQNIIKRLDEIATSPFVTTPQESFHTMQEDWRLEIEQMFDELRSREKVWWFGLYVSVVFIKSGWYCSPPHRVRHTLILREREVVKLIQPLPYWWRNLVALVSVTKCTQRDRERKKIIQNLFFWKQDVHFLN